MIWNLNALSISYSFIAASITSAVYAAFVLVLPRCTQIRMFTVRNDKDKCDAILKHMENANMLHFNCEHGLQMPTGISISRNEWVWISKDGESRSRHDSCKMQAMIIILCTKARFAELCKKKVCNDAEDEDDEDEEKKNTGAPLTILNRSGDFFGISYSRMEVSMRIAMDAEKFPEQTRIVNSIVSTYESGAVTLSCLITGPPGGGKTSIGLFVAHVLKGNLCKTFNPTQPGDTLSSLVQDFAKPRKENPLVVVFDEFDIMISGCHYERIPQHKHIPIEVSSKTSLNRFFDDLHTIYSHVIVIATSNRSKEHIDAEMDPSYLRAGRFTHHFAM
jgi:hypothetical protein